MAAMVILIIIIASSTVSAKAFVDGGTLILNEKKKVYCVTDKYGMPDEQWFYYTPDDSRYYVAETSGELDSVLRVGNPYFEIVNNNITPQNDNSRIWFKAEAGRQFRVDIRFCFTFETKYTTLQLRKQRFSMFGYVDYNGYNFKKDFEKPYNDFMDMYDVVKIEDESASYAKGYDERGLSRLNSEIVFFTGHGAYYDKAGKYEKDQYGVGVSFYYNNKYLQLTYDESLNFENTKVAVWSACNSADTDNIKNLSFAEYTVKCGAASAVGFADAVNSSSARTFTNKFFSVLAGGGTVAEAASAGKGAVIWPWDAAKKYVLFGDRTIRVTDETPSGEDFYWKPANYEYLREELANGYVAEPLDGNDTRYYQTVNGYLTDSYIDITEVNGRIVAIADHRKAYDKVLGIDDNCLVKGSDVVLKNRAYAMREESGEHVVYCNIDGVMTPVKVSFITCTGSRGEVCCEAECINLNDGSAIDYAKICGLDE